MSTSQADGDGATVRIRGLGKDYRSFSLGPLSFDLHPGITGVLGLNGAGKTTLLRILVGTLAPDGGRVEWPADAVAGIGYMPQSLEVMRGLSVRQFLAYMAWLQKVPPSRASERVDKCLKQFELTDHATKPLSRLSGGLLRRTVLAQSVIHRPALLILDEPTANLDPAQRIRLRHLIQHNLDSRWVLISTHLLEDVTLVAQNLVVLDEGRLAFAGAISELLADPHEGAFGDTPLERALHSLLGDPFRGA